MKEPMLPAMTAPEVECLSKYMAGSSNYLEFGCGGSTMLAARIGVPRLDTIDSSKEWIDRVSHEDPMPAKIRSGAYRTHHVDIGPIGPLGAPSDLATATKWPSYSLSIWGKLRTTPDLVLVDGRFRLSCALQTLIHTADETILLIHDFERHYYHPILRFTNVIERVDNLVALRRKSAIDAYDFATECVKSLLKPE